LTQFVVAVGQALDVKQIYETEVRISSDVGAMKSCFKRGVSEMGID